VVEQYMVIKVYTNVHLELALPQVLTDMKQHTIQYSED